MKTSFNFGRAFIGGVVVLAIAFAANQSAEASGGHGPAARSGGTARVAAGRNAVAFHGNNFHQNHVANHNVNHNVNHFVNHHPVNHHPVNNYIHHPYIYHPHVPVRPWIGYRGYGYGYVGTEVVPALQIMLPADQPEPVTYMLNGAQFTIQPGEVQTVNPGTCEFDRGNGQGAAYGLTAGLYKFQFTDAGLELFPAQ